MNRPNIFDENRCVIGVLGYFYGFIWINLNTFSVFTAFKIIAHRIWRYFSAIIRLQHIVIFCVSVRSRFGLKRHLDLFYFSLSHTMQT